MLKLEDIVKDQMYILKEDFVFVCPMSERSEDVAAGEIVRAIAISDVRFNPSCTTVVVELPDGSAQGMACVRMLELLPNDLH